MARGPKKHMKRLNAPKHWMLDKLTGVWAPRPSTGPHKLRECLPLIVLLRNRLKYALSRREVVLILMQRTVKVDGKVRTDPTYPAGFMDVVNLHAEDDNGSVTLDRTFRLLYDEKGRFVPVAIDENESNMKLCKVVKLKVGKRDVPFIVTHDGRTIRYPDPDIRVNDTVQINLETGKVSKIVKFETGNIVMATGGRNIGRVGLIEHVEKHHGGFDIVHLVDAKGRQFATRLSNIFTLGKGKKSLVKLPKHGGVKLTIEEDRAKRLEEAEE